MSARTQTLEPSPRPTSQEEDFLAKMIWKTDGDAALAAIERRIGELDVLVAGQERDAEQGSGRRPLWARTTRAYLEERDRLRRRHDFITDEKEGHGVGIMADPDEEGICASLVHLFLMGKPDDGVERLLELAKVALAADDRKLVGLLPRLEHVVDELSHGIPRTVYEGQECANWAEVEQHAVEVVRDVQDLAAELRDLILAVADFPINFEGRVARVLEPFGETEIALSLAALHDNTTPLEDDIELDCLMADQAWYEKQGAEMGTTDFPMLDFKNAALEDLRAQRLDLVRSQSAARRAALAEQRSRKMAEAVQTQRKVVRAAKADLKAWRQLVRASANHPELFPRTLSTALQSAAVAALVDSGARAWASVLDRP